MQEPVSNNAEEFRSDYACCCLLLLLMFVSRCDAVMEDETSKHGVISTYHDDNEEKLAEHDYQGVVCDDAD